MFQSMTNTSRRANRLEYLFGLLIIGMGMMISFAVMMAGGGASLIGLGMFFVLFVFDIILTKNRFNDFGYSGWWMLVPFASLVAFFVPGDATDNKFGPKV